MYVTQWSRPEIGNSVRELSKFSSKPQICHQSAMERVIIFAFVIKIMGGH
jgi:hypothetical protein